MNMPKIIYMRDDNDDGIELTSRDDPAAMGYVRCDIFESDETSLEAEIVRLQSAIKKQNDTIKKMYQKHCLADDSIGWVELDGILRDTLCETMGDREFQAWLDEHD